jgi:thiamine pyrophosphate-dependent acetolactate synthase large subunit-like protein
VSAGTDFCRVASGAGYVDSVAVSEETGITGAVERALRSRGPHFIRIMVRRGSEHGIGRVKPSPEEIRQTFMKNLDRPEG